MRREPAATWVVCRVQPSNDDDDGGGEEGSKPKDAVPEKKLLEDEKPVRDEPYQSEEEAEQKVFNRLLLPQRIGEIANRAFYAAGIIFVFQMK